MTTGRMLLRNDNHRAVRQDACLLEGSSLPRATSLPNMSSHFVSKKPGSYSKVRIARAMRRSRQQATRTTGSSKAISAGNRCFTEYLSQEISSFPILCHPLAIYCQYPGRFEQAELGALYNKHEYTARTVCQALLPSYRLRRDPFTNRAKRPDTGRWPTPARTG